MFVPTRDSVIEYAMKELLTSCGDALEFFDKEFIASTNSDQRKKAKEIRKSLRDAVKLVEGIKWDISQRRF